MNTTIRLSLSDIAAQVAADTRFTAAYHNRALSAGRIALMAAAQLMPPGPEKDVLAALCKIMREQDIAVERDPNTMDVADLVNVFDDAAAEYRERAAHYQSGGYQTPRDE